MDKPGKTFLKKNVTFICRCHFNLFPVNVRHAVTRYFTGIQSWTKWSGLDTFAKQSTRSLVTSFPAIWPVNSFITGPSSVMAPMSSLGWQRTRAPAPWPPPVALTFLLLAVTHLKLQFYFTTFILLTTCTSLHSSNHSHLLHHLTLRVWRL